MNLQASVIAIANQKGGIGKTTTCSTLAAVLGKLGFKVCQIDFDPQSNHTLCFRHNLYEIDFSISELLVNTANNVLVVNKKKYMLCAEKTDLVPSNMNLSRMELSIAELEGRESLLKRYIQTIRYDYDFILIDCMPSLNLLTVNALTAADSVLIPVEGAYLAYEGLNQLIDTIYKAKQTLNPGLK